MMKLLDLLSEELDNLFGPVFHGGSWDGKKPVKVNGRGSLGVGAYFTPSQTRSNEYAKEASGQVIEAWLKLNKPLVIRNSRLEHPCIKALVTLGMDQAKATKLVERVEESQGYMGSEIKTLATRQGYDSIIQYEATNTETPTEIVIWSPAQVARTSRVSATSGEVKSL